MEEPDYDDLIEDYMEDMEEPPPQEAAPMPEYDEDFLAEIEAAQAAEKDQTNNIAAEPNDDDLQSPISKNLSGRLASASPSRTTNTGVTDEASSPSPAQVRRDFASNRVQTGSTSPDIFSFER